jgi:hypothetical protein
MSEGAVFTSDLSAIEVTRALHKNSELSSDCPPKLGGQHDRDAVEIVRGVVPKPHSDRVCFGTTPRGIRFAIPLPS